MRRGATSAAGCRGGTHEHGSLQVPGWPDCFWTKALSGEVRLQSCSKIQRQSKIQSKSMNLLQGQKWAGLGLCHSGLLGS